MDNNTPRSERVHIGLFGLCNSGKSSLMNALTGQQVALVSAVAGTTTDPVVKSMELPDLGAVTFIDTAGIDDRGALGEARVAQAQRAIDRCDVAIFVATDSPTPIEIAWVERLKEGKIGLVVALNKCDLCANSEEVAQKWELISGVAPICVSATTGVGVAQLRTALAEAGGAQLNPTTITGNLVQAGDVVMLVMPQDSQAPKGRLILPQVQTIRELLDKGCTIVSTTPELMSHSLEALAAPPHLIITDSQAFTAVSALTPSESLLTSFSILFAHYKGDIREFVAGASVLGRLAPTARVLIAEACTHAPTSEDIGRVKLPRMLRQRFGDGLQIDIVGGNDLPDDLSPYQLVIHCGACMFNRQHVLARIARAQRQGISITNYGVAIAYLTGILDRVAYPTY